MKIIQLVRQFIINAETSEALNSLFNYVQPLPNKDRTNEVILLLSDFNELLKKNRKGLGEYNEEKNRINLAVLSILNELEEESEPDDDPAIPVSPDVLFAGINQKLDLLEGQLQMIHHQMERLLDDGMERFQHSAIWKDLEKKTRDHILAAIAMERDKYLDNYSMVILEMGNALEHELRTKLFQPYKTLMNEQHPDLNRNVFMDNTDGQLKNVLYKYVYNEDSNITLNQMVGILSENLEERDKERDREEPFLHFLRFLYSQYRIMNLSRLMESLTRINDWKIERIAKSFVHTKDESDELKKLVLDVFRSLQLSKGS